MLRPATFAYNSKINETTGVSSFEVWFGRCPKLPIDLILPTPGKEFTNEDQVITETMRRFQLMYDHIRKRSNATFARNAKSYSGATQLFKIGDRVWVFTKRKVTGKSDKIVDSWIGPYKIVGQPAEVLFEVVPAETAGRKITKHVTSLRRYNEQIGLTKGRIPEIAKDDDGDDLAEEVGQPERWVEPTNAVIEVPETPPKKVVEIPEKEAEKTVADTEEPKESQVSTEKKRVRTEPEPDNGKKAKLQGIKRDRESEGEEGHKYETRFKKPEKGPSGDTSWERVQNLNWILMDWIWNRNYPDSKKR